MTDLTEQWKKGEFPEGHYYVKDGENMIAEYIDGYFYNDGNPMTSFSGGVDEVLAPVPSYDELQNMNNAVNECMAANIKLVEENKQLKERNDSLNNRDINLCRIANGIRDENFALKELLKECSIANTALVGIMDWLRKSTIPEQRENCEYLFEKTQELQKQLDEALR